MQYLKNHSKVIKAVYACVIAGLAGIFVLSFFAHQKVSAQVENPQDGSVGLQGQISAPPPSQGATITVPTNGQTFRETPITVSGICPEGLLVKVFKNNVFSGSVQCDGGSYSVQVDLFTGQNELVARVFDALDQPGPDSNLVTVTFDDSSQGAFNRPSLTSPFAKKGANPGEKLVWPIVLSGGTGPYAISVDWGDGSDLDLISQAFPGTFNIEHVYDNPGIYNVIVRATDANGLVAFLQLVGVANGAAGQSGVSGGPDGGQEFLPGAGQTRILWQPAAILIPFIISTFWLGKKYQLKSIKMKIERGQRPF